jgi:hypothetical protein
MTIGIDDFDPLSIGYVPPDYVPPKPPPSGDWANIASLAAGRTDYRSVNFSGLNPGGTANLNGTYTVLSSTAHQVTLSNPEIINPNWSDIDVATAYSSASLSTSGERWVGPFVVDLDGLDRVMSNFIALGGLYSINKEGKQYAVSVEMLMEVTPVDQLDSDIGPPEFFYLTLTGDNTLKSQVADTLTGFVSVHGRSSVRVRRLTPTDLNYEGTLVDEVKWRDAYGMAQVDVDNFGDITMAHARTYATSGATSVKDRKLNLNARRRVPERVDGVFTEHLVGSDRIDDIISAICLDPRLGNRPPGQVDFDNIYDIVGEVEDYFGSPLACEFGYTFDNDNVSFEEMIITVASASFCRPYRQGAVIRLKFERATEDSVILFNHRNILPKTQHRAVNFGVLDDHDGIELDWTAAKDGASLSYEIPYDRTALSPLKTDMPGVRSPQLAYWHSWRAWNRLQFQSVSLEQETTQEAALVIPSDRILVTNLTAPPGFEGQVMEVDGLNLRLSQPTTFAEDVDHTIFIQHVDATVEALGVGPWVPGVDEDEDPYWVTLANTPRLSLAVGVELSYQTLYEIIPATDRRPRAYLVTEREPNSNFTENLRAINYSPMYYINDEIVTWLPFSEPSFRDQSPWMRDGVGVGDATTVFDDPRAKYVFRGTGSGSSVHFSTFTPPSSYTKAVWVNRDDQTTDASLLAATHEVFGFVGSQLNAGHDGTQVSLEWPAMSVWHHVAITYDIDAGEMFLYLDGQVVDQADGVPSRTLAQFTAFTGFLGRADDLRLWKRALTPTEVDNLWRATRVRPGGFLGTEDGFAITTEDGQNINLG